MTSALSLRLLAACIAAGTLSACSCADIDLFCNLPPSSFGRGAVFIGRVLDIFPREKQTLQPGNEKSPIDLVAKRCAELFVSFAPGSPLP